MCARYTFIPEHIRRKPLPSEVCFPDHAEPRYNISPEQFAIVTRWREGDPQCDELQWGFAPGWMDPSTAQVNLRAEALFGTLMFNESAERRRCIVLASGWYEWPDKGQGDDPCYYFRSEGGLIGFAGIWAHNFSAKVDTFAIVTTVADATSTLIRNRTPVILREDDYGLWLNPAVSSEASLSRTLRPYEPADLDNYRVAFTINDPTVDSVKCIERVDSADLPQRKNEAKPRPM